MISGLPADVPVPFFHSLNPLSQKQPSSPSSKTLQPLVGWLEGRRDEEQSLLERHLQSKRFQKFSQSWNAFLHGQSSIDLNTEEPPHIKSLASRRIRRLWQSSLKEGRAIPDEEAHFAFHELRKTCKKLRDLLEAFRPLYSKKEILAPVKSLK